MNNLQTTANPSQNLRFVPGGTPVRCPAVGVEHAGTSKGGERVLVVTEDIETSKAVRYVLRDAGYSVIASFSLVDALRSLLTRRVDIVLVDLDLKSIGDTELITALRNHVTPEQTTILGMTGSVWDVSDNTMNAGCAGLVTKPVTRELLLRALQRHRSQQ